MLKTSFIYNPNTLKKKMAVKILFIENGSTPESLECKLLCDSKAVSYAVVKGVEDVSAAFSLQSYSHIVCNLKYCDSSISFLKSLNLNVPTLIICDSSVNLDLTGVQFSVIQKPLTYKELFNFIAKKTIISNSTLEKYAMGDQDFIAQMKQLIIEEFEENLSKIPTYLQEEDFKAVKSNMHQLIGKFAMLEMNQAHQLSKQIDANILIDTVNEIPHVHHVLFDVEIALTQLKCSA